MELPSGHAHSTDARGECPHARAHTHRKAVPGHSHPSPSPPGPPGSDSPLSQTRSSIPVSHIRAVERVDEGAFQLPHVMQVVTQDGAGALHTTYLQCKVRRREYEGGAEGAPWVPPHL